MASAYEKDDPVAEGPTTTNEGQEDITAADKGEQNFQRSVTDKVFENAKAATEKENKMTLLQGIKLYPKAVAWSLLISTCIVMEGYDISLVSNFFAFPQFNKKYGVLGDDGTYQVPASVSPDS